MFNVEWRNGQHNVLNVDRLQITLENRYWSNQTKSDESTKRVCLLHWTAANGVFLCRLPARFHQPHTNKLQVTNKLHTVRSIVFVYSFVCVCVCVYACKQMAMSVTLHWETFEEILSGWSVFHLAMLLLFPLYQQWINYPNDGYYRDGSPCECAAMCSHGCDSTASVTGHLGSLRKQKCYLSDKSRRAECDSHCGKRNLMRHLPLSAVWLRGIHHFVLFCFLRHWRSECLTK